MELISALMDRKTKNYNNDEINKYNSRNKFK